MNLTDMVQKKRISQKQVNLSGLFLAAVLILISAFLSSIAYEPQAGPIPRIETTGRSVTGFATSFTATCSDGATIFRATANSLAAPYNTADTTTYSKKVCADSSLGSGHTCIYSTAPTTTTTGPATLPSHCSNSVWDGDESDQDCGGSCNKCSSGLSCWGNSDCSSGMCWFDSATMTKRAGASITKDQRLSPISTNIQYQGVCVTTAPSTGGIVGGAVVDITGNQVASPARAVFFTPSSANNYASCPIGYYSQGVFTQGSNQINFCSLNGQDLIRTASTCPTGYVYAGSIISKGAYSGQPTTQTQVCSRAPNNQQEVTIMDITNSYGYPDTTRLCPSGYSSPGYLASGGYVTGGGGSAGVRYMQFCVRNIVPITATCTDGIKNQDETGIDCGGSTCTAKCGSGKSCNINNDCSAGYSCVNSVCTSTTQTTTQPSPPTAPTITTIPTTTTTAPAAPLNRIIRIGSDNTVEKAGYSGSSATSQQPTIVTFNGAITTCTQRVDILPGTCTPPAGPTGTKKLGTIEEFNTEITPNGVGVPWTNVFAIYVSDSINGDVVKCAGAGCNLPVCTKGKLQAIIEEYISYDSVNIRYGICADKKIMLASCTQTTKGRTCTTTAPEQGLTKLTNYITDQYRTASGSYKAYVYHDLYIQSQETIQQPTPVSYSDVCFGNGPYHYEDKTQRTNKANGACDAGSCIFTISADTGAKVADCSSNGYSTSVCSGGYCVGTDCDQLACQDQLSCNSNPSCAWDALETRPGKSKCQSRGNVCYDPGKVGICTPAAFRSGDYSCLYKEGPFYTRACVGAGNIAFWQIPEVY